MTSQQLSEAKRVLVSRERVARRRAEEIERGGDEQQIRDLMHDLQACNRTLARLGWMDEPDHVKLLDVKEARTFVTLQG